MNTRFLAVLGSSGTGKSSLVKAGLLSDLEKGLLPKAGSRWRIVQFRPGGDALDELAKGLPGENLLQGATGGVADNGGGNRTMSVAHGETPSLSYSQT